MYLWVYTGKCYSIAQISEVIGAILVYCLVAGWCALIVVMLARSCVETEMANSSDSRVTPGPGTSRPRRTGRLSQLRCFPWWVVVGQWVIVMIEFITFITSPAGPYWSGHLVCDVRESHIGELHPLVSSSRVQYVKHYQANRRLKNIHERSMLISFCRYVWQHTYMCTERTAISHSYIGEVNLFHQQGLRVIIDVIYLNAALD